MTSESLGDIPHSPGRQFVTLGMFIIDEFEYLDATEKPTGRTQTNQIGGAGTYAAIGARIWLQSNQIGMIVDKGNDFPAHIYHQLRDYGLRMWHFRDNDNHQTTRGVNRYVGDERQFDYRTPRIRLTPIDLANTPLMHPNVLHFICSPSRAHTIIHEVRQIPDWDPITVYEPIPDRCIPEELPALLSVLPYISILSPNHEEAFRLLSLPLSQEKYAVEDAARGFLGFGIGTSGDGAVIIRAGAHGAFISTRARGGQWFDAFWKASEAEQHIVDVTGAGNAFLGGLSAGLKLTDGDLYEAMPYAIVSAAYTIEQAGLPLLTGKNEDVVLEEWNEQLPKDRLQEYLSR